MTFVPQIGMVELIFLAVLALLVVGPKDLPRMMAGVGKALAKVRRLADDFKASFDQMAREAEIDEMRKEIEALKASNPVTEMRSAIDEAGQAAKLPSDPGSPSHPSKEEPESK